MQEEHQPLFLRQNDPQPAFGLKDKTLWFELDLRNPLNKKQVRYIAQEFPFPLSMVIELLEYDDQLSGMIRLQINELNRHIFKTIFANHWNGFKTRYTRYDTKMYEESV